MKVLNINMEHTGIIAITLLIGCVMFYMFFGIDRVDKNAPAQQRENIEGIIRNALVQCYALEGSYPATLDELRRYGVIFDEVNFYYEYETIGANIMPNVIVIPK